ncbi:hypothetical protein C8F04DRAFT_1402456 [Mycena alexandri]|uniref:BTB domain-containing protein n=1 Tax=Mycena alexandri TaxID=1745969 RepID=A0AAD6SB82_9AGAR|nr:hypothetical protein C8F04DRAFT_1402456 [Mycena alexandri]
MDGTHALSLQEATRNSTSAWQRDLAALFSHAKDRFPDVVWELSSEDAGVEEVYGHKAIVYARAPPSFQSRYFSFRPQEQRHSPLAASALSLDIPRTRSPSPSPFRTASPAPSTNAAGLTRLPTSINPALFSNELEYLYTGQGFGEAFEFLFDEQGEESATEDPEELRIDKLRKDLVFMWRSRLYSDVRIALAINGPLPAGDDDDAHDRQMPVFSSHRFILASRSPYFHTALVSWPAPQKPLSLSSSLNGSNPLTLSLPSPPFTPASLHFTLGFLYTGTLIFSHRTYDLSTALALLLSATYLSLPTLHAEVQARIVSEMAHGLFHAALPFAAYDALTKGAWRAGGCTCRKCAARVPRILEFALRPDVQDVVLERGARRALVGLFGVGWCTPEFAALPAKLHASALKGLLKRTTPPNALPILWAAEAARARLAPLVDAWADIVRPLIDAGRAQVDALMGNQTAEVLSADAPDGEWGAIMRTDGVRFEDGERVEWAMRSVVRGVNEGNAGRVYQALVNVLLLPHPDPTEEGSFPAQPLLSQTSHVRVQVEQARMDTLTWLKRGGRGRADRVAREGGFDGVEGWAVREVGDHLEIPVDDLLSAIPPSNSTASQAHARLPTTHTAPTRKSTAFLSAAAGGRPLDADAHSLSIHTQQSSMRVSVLSRAIATPRGARSVRGAKVDAGVEEENENEEEEHVAEEGEGEKPEDAEGGDRPDSKLTPEMGGAFLGVGAGLTLKGKERANGSGGSLNGSAPPSPTVATMKKPPVPTRAPPATPSSSASNTSTSPSGATTPKYARSTVSVSVSPAPAARPRSAASSVRTGTTASVHAAPRPGSAASTRTTSTVRTTRGLRPPPLGTSSPSTAARRASGASTSASASLSEFRTAMSGTAASRSRSRQSSVSSVVSQRSVGAGARSRKTSGASDVSVRTTGAGNATSGVGAAARPPVPALDPSVRRRATPSVHSVSSRSVHSVRSVAGSTSTMDTAASAARKATLVVKKPETKVITLKHRGRGTAGAGGAGAASAKEKEKEKEKIEEGETETPTEEKERDHRKTDSTASTASASTLRVKRKGSGDTVSTVTTRAGPAPSASSTSRTATTTAKPKTAPGAPKRPAPQAPAPGTLKDLVGTPRGATLEIGIPCIISSKRKRFKAFARYIGEVEGEAGPWVGVEVPAAAADGMGFSSSGKDKGARQWHDGSWGGVRYFEIGPGAGSDWEYGDEGRDRAARRRRLEGSGTSGASSFGFGAAQKGVKREGESMLGGGGRGAKRIRSASPAVSDADGAGESRGLFVRPSAVLYVVDAVGADL